MTKYSLTCLLLAACFTACDNDHKAPVNPDLDYPAVITAKAYTYDKNAEGTTWVGPEFAIGVSVLKDGKNGEEVIDTHANLQYLANGLDNQDYFVPADIKYIPYFPATGEKRHFAAYFPYSQEVIDQQLPIDLHTGKEYAEKLLFARINNLDKDHRKMLLKMRPALSLITFKFKVSEDMTAEVLKSIQVKLKDFHMSGLFNTVNGTMSFRAIDTPTGEIVLAEPEAKKEKTKAAAQEAPTSRILQGIALPSAETATYEVVVEFKNKEGENKVYTQKLSAENINELVGSYEYTFEPTFTADGQMLLNCQSAPIINWQPGDDNISGEGEEIPSDKPQGESQPQGGEQPQA